MGNSDMVDAVRLHKVLVRFYEKRMIVCSNFFDGTPLTGHFLKDEHSDGTAGFASQHSPRCTG